LQRSLTHSRKKYINFFFPGFRPKKDALGKKFLIKFKSPQGGRAGSFSHPPSGYIKFFIKKYISFFIPAGDPASLRGGGKNKDEA